MTSLRKILPSALLLLATAGSTTGCELIASVDRSLIDEGSGERGVLGGYMGGQVFGWAVSADSSIPAAVRLVVDGDEQFVQANGARPDLVVKGIDPEGDAGFKVDVGALPAGTEIAAFIVGSELELTNSPFIVGAGSTTTTTGSAGGGTGAGGGGGAGGN